MSITSAKRKPTKQIDRCTVGNTFDEVCAQEIAAHDRYVMEIAKEMSRPKNVAKPKAPK